MTRDETLAGELRERDMHATLARAEYMRVVTWLRAQDVPVPFEMDEAYIRHSFEVESFGNAPTLADLARALSVPPLPAGDEGREAEPMPFTKSERGFKFYPPIHSNDAEIKVFESSGAMEPLLWLIVQTEREAATQITLDQAEALRRTLAAAIRNHYQRAPLPGDAQEEGDRDAG